MLEAFRESGYLCVENFLAAFAQRLFAARHEGMCVHFASQLAWRRASFQSESDRGEFALHAEVQLSVAKAVRSKSIAAKVDRMMLDANMEARKGYELRAAHSEPGLEPGAQQDQLPERAGSS